MDYLDTIIQLCCCIISLFFLVVQDVAFQLERLVGGMYVYSRQSYKILKPACVFPIEVHLELENTPPILQDEDDIEEEKEKEKEKEQSPDKEVVLTPGYPHEEKGEEEQIISDDLISI